MTDKAKSKLQTWKVLETKDVYVAKPWLGVSVQRVELPDGSVIDDYHQVYFPEYVTVVASTPEDCFVMIRKYNHGFGEVSVVLAGGMKEDNEDALLAAKRELQEETGYSSDEWTSLGSYIPHSNYGCGRTHLLWAKGAKQVSAPMSGDLEEMEVVVMNEDEIWRSIKTEKIVCMSSVIALSLVLNPRFCP